MDRTRHSRDRDRDRDREKEREKDRLRDTEDKHREKDERGRWRERERSGEERKRASKNPTRDHHRRHLEKLMEHPEKPVDIPEPTRDRKPKDPPDFVRFYMGSSAGAGSEVFHVYRHLRRRENDRQDYIFTQAIEEDLDDDFQQTLAAHRAEADARTAKKRAKRLKRKQRQKLKKKGNGQSGMEKIDEERNSDHEADVDHEEEPHFVIGGK